MAEPPEENVRPVEMVNGAVFRSGDRPKVAPGPAVIRRGDSANIEQCSKNPADTPGFEQFSDPYLPKKTGRIGNFGCAKPQMFATFTLYNEWFGRVAAVSKDTAAAAPERDASAGVLFICGTEFRHFLLRKNSCGPAPAALPAPP